MGYYPQFTSPIESDIFGSNDSLIVRHFVDSLFYGLCWTSVLIRGGERAAVARWSAKQSCLDGAPHPVGHCPAAAQLTLALSLLLPLPSFLPIHSSPHHNPLPPSPQNRHQVSQTDAQGWGFRCVSVTPWCGAGTGQWEGPAGTGAEESSRRQLPRSAARGNRVG